MKVAVASGKGGTGKTMLSASLTWVWQGPLVAVDLDVEEPNLHLYLNPQISGRQPASLEVPVVDESKCNFCRKCSELCQFKAISVLNEVVLIFDEMCHGCGGCLKICPQQALTGGARELGEISWGHNGSGRFLMGRLRVGEAMSPPLMRAVKHQLADMLAAQPADVIIDAPPGVSCPAVNAVMDSDVILLVTEPTPFGLYDLKLAHEAFSQFNKPMAVVINRSGFDNTSVKAFCAERRLPVFAEIPFDRRIAESYAAGHIVVQALSHLKPLFSKLAEQIRQLAAHSVNSKEICCG
jgi:MinD superfamily P-loop ATPase